MEGAPGPVLHHTVGLRDISEVCREHGVGDSSGCDPGQLVAMVDAMVSRQPLREGDPSPSHMMWLARETAKLMKRHADLDVREKQVSRRERDAAPVR